MSRQAKVLLLDEPTATLSDAEIVRVFDVARKLRDQGTAMIFVSHRLDEVFALTDRVTVFRNGQHVLTQRTADMTTAEVVKAMIGRELVHSKGTPPEGRADVAPRLSVSSLTVADKVKDLSVDVAPGEILAVVGQLGSGAEVLVEALAGLRGDISNSVKVDGQPIKLDSIRSSLKAGIAYVAEDRADKGVFLDAPIAINITASVMAKFSKAGIMRRAGEQEEARRLASMFAIDPKRLPHEVSTLSGGNQQKVSLAKAVALAPRLLLLNEPTRGVDIALARKSIRRFARWRTTAWRLSSTRQTSKKFWNSPTPFSPSSVVEWSAISLDLKSMVTRCSTTSSRAIATHLTDMSLSETNPRRWVMHKTALEPTAQVSPTALRRWASALFGTSSIHAASIQSPRLFSSSSLQPSCRTSRSSGTFSR